MSDQKIEPCPYCGSKCYIVTWATNSKKNFLRCENSKCRYGSGNSLTIPEAIAAHNKVSCVCWLADRYPGLFDATEEFFRKDKTAPEPIPGNHHPDESLDPLFQAYIGVLEAIDNE